VDLTAETDNMSRGGELVVLVHGLMRSWRCMRFTGRGIERAGFRVRYFDYPTRQKKIAVHGEDFRNFLSGLWRENPGVPINIVTHSMGGIITRAALADREKAPFYSALRRVVMIAPPNKGSHAARLLTSFKPARAFFDRFVRPLSELSSAPGSFVSALPCDFPDIEIGIIAGKYDLHVAVPLIHLPCERDCVLLPVEHELLLLSTAVARQTVSFLKTGAFVRP
jgi:pimeloyl-ACP methyl ester carboxylesterase